MSDYTEGKLLSQFVNVGIDIDNFYKETAWNFMMNDMFLVGFGNFRDHDLFIPRMSMSPTFRRIIKWMDTRIERDSQNLSYLGYTAPKLVIYSGHDTNIAAIEAFMKAAGILTEYQYIPFATKLRYTLWRKISKDSNKIYTEDDYQVSFDLNGMKLASTISFKDFKEKVQKVLVSPEEISEFCGWNTKIDGTFTNQTLLISTICLSVVTIVLFVYIIILHKQKSKIEEKGINYEKINL